MEWLKEARMSAWLEEVLHLVKRKESYLDPFIRVFPIKNGEYGTATPQIYSLDSQRFGSFEVLAIAVASFLITITVKS